MMRQGFGHLERLSDIAEADVVAATLSQEECAALLAKLGELADGAAVAPILLTLFTRVAVLSRWLDGDLAVEMSAADGGTRVSVSSELGGGMRERVLAPVTLRVALEELASALDGDLGGEDLLRLERASEGRVLLLATDSLPASTDFEISHTCLATAAGIEDDVDAGWDA